jgi:hypothetical protein
MVQRRQYLRLALEATHASGVARERLRQHFHRNVALQLGIVGTVDLSR